MRITIATGPWYSLPPAPCGAVERVWHGLAPHFVARGHEVTFLCRAWGDLPGDEIRDGVRYIRRTRFSMTQKLPIDLVKDLLYTARMFPKLPPADVLVTNNVWMPLLLARIPFLKIGKMVPSIARMPKRQMKFYLRSGRLSPVSHAVAREIIHQCPRASNLISVVPNPIDTDVFKPSSEPKDPSRPKTILYAGRIHPEKGLDLLMHAFGRLRLRMPDARLVLVGPQRVEDGGGGTAYISHLKTLGGHTNVEFRDPVYGRLALADVYRSADVFVYPSVASQGEASPVAPLEAMACGLITIVSDLEQFRDYLTPDVNGIVFDHRGVDPVAALTDAMERAIRATPEAHDTMSKAAAATGQRFSYAAVADLYLQDWQALVHNQPVPAPLRPIALPQPPAENKPLKISIVTGPFLPTPPGPAGAVERRWYYVAEHFVRKGHDVTFTSKHADGLKQSEILRGVKHQRFLNLSATRWLPINLIKDFAYAVRILPKLPKADILVTNDATLPLLAPWLRSGAGKISMNVARVPKGQMALYRGVRRYIGVSNMIGDEIRRQAPSLGPRIRVVPNPIDTNIFRVENDADLLAGSRNEIVFTGRIHPEKGLETLIRAHAELVKEFPDLTLRLIGPVNVAAGGGGERYLKKLEALAGNAAVEFTPPIYERPALAAAIRRGRYYCYPSLAERGEAFPCAPLEAMGCGRVPVVSNLDQFKDYVHNGDNGVIFDHKAADPVASLVAALRSLITDPARLEHMSHTAAATACDYSFSHIADLYLADFYAMLNTRDA